MRGDRARRAGRLVLCLSLLAYGYFVYRGPHHNPDSRLALTYSLVERQDLDIDPYAATTLDRAYRDGHYYTDKAPGVSFALAPLYAGLRAILPPALVDVGTPEQPDRFVVRYLLTFLGIGVPAALFNVALFSWLGWLEPRPGPRLAVTLGYALGSPAYPFTVSAFGHVPAAMALGGALMLLWPPSIVPPASAKQSGRGYGRLIGVGLLLGLAVTLEYPAGLGSLAIGGLALWQARDRHAAAVALAAGAAPPLLLLGAYHWAVFGSPLSVGYAHLAPGTEYVAGQAGGLLGVHWPNPSVAVALLAGAHRGLLVFAPWLALAVPGAWLLWRRQEPGHQQGNLPYRAGCAGLCVSPRQGLGDRQRDGRALVVAAAGTFGALLLVNSGYVFWDGGASWGPRHLVPALPFLAALALPAAARWPRPAWALAGVSVVVTLAGVATGSLPDSEVRSPLIDLVWPRALAGGVTNNWGQVAGLAAWRGLVPLAALVSLLVAWTCGWRRSAGALVVAGWCLVAIARLNRDYLEYSEGYYLYLGSRVAAGARLYAETASTQPPLLPLLIGALWRIQPDVWLPRLFAIGCYALAALFAGRLAARLAPAPWTAPAATALAALLPLGAGTPQVLDANAVLAPLAVALALLWTRAVTTDLEGRSPSFPAAAAGAVAAIGLATKLTFAPFAVVPLLSAPAGRRTPPGRERRGLKPPATPAKPPKGGSWWIPHHQGASASFADVAGAFMPRRSMPRRSMPRRSMPRRSMPRRSMPRPFLPWLLTLAWPPTVAQAVHPRVVYALALTACLAAQAIYWLVAAGPSVADAVLGELESPLHPAGALLAYFQLAYLECVPLVLAAAGWWHLRRRQPDHPLRWFGLASAALPLFAAHQGTFVGVARPAEPFIAAFAVAGLDAGERWLRGCLGSGWLQRAAVGLAGLATALTPGAWSGGKLFGARTVDPNLVLAPLSATMAPDQPVLAPPYYAALAGRTMLFDYPDWTVWGMRAAAGAPRERQLASETVEQLRRRQLPIVAADFRLAYVGSVADALARDYRPAGSDGDDAARAVTLWLPK